MNVCAPNYTAMIPATPKMQRNRPYTFSVWVLSISLAATEEIEVSFFSLRYLDVSVLSVVLTILFDSDNDTGVRDSPGGLPHSEISGSQLVWQLPEAYRSLPRPSSASSTKTFTVYP